MEIDPALHKITLKTRHSASGGAGSSEPPHSLQPPRTSPLWTVARVVVSLKCGWFSLLPAAGRAGRGWTAQVSGPELPMGRRPQVVPCRPPSGLLPSPGTPAPWETPGCRAALMRPPPPGRHPGLGNSGPRRFLWPHHFRLRTLVCRAGLGPLCGWRPGRHTARLLPLRPAHGLHGARALATREHGGLGGLTLPDGVR